MSSPPLAHQPRPHALADLEALIVKAERARLSSARLADRVAAAGLDPARARAMLRLAEDRLAQLHASRQVLLHGDAGDAPGEGKGPDP